MRGADSPRLIEAAGTGSPDPERRNAFSSDLVSSIVSLREASEFQPWNDKTRPDYLVNRELSLGLETTEDIYASPVRSLMKPNSAQVEVPSSTAMKRLHERCGLDNMSSRQATLQGMSRESWNEIEASGVPSSVSKEAQAVVVNQLPNSDALLFKLTALQTLSDLRTARGVSNAHV